MVYECRDGSSLVHIELDTRRVRVQPAALEYRQAGEHGLRV